MVMQLANELTIAQTVVMVHTRDTPWDASTTLQKYKPVASLHNAGIFSSNTLLNLLPCEGHWLDKVYASASCAVTWNVIHDL